METAVFLVDELVTGDASERSNLNRGKQGVGIDVLKDNPVTKKGP